MMSERLAKSYKFRTAEEAVQDPEVYEEARRLWREDKDRTDAESVRRHNAEANAGNYHRISNEQIWKAVENLRKKATLTRAQ